MSTDPTQTGAELEKAEALRYRAMASRLADMAMEVTDYFIQEFRAAPAADKPAQAAHFERASRTARRCLLLARKLAEPLPTPRPTPRHAANPSPAPAPAPASGFVPDRTALRKRIIREVEDLIERSNRIDKVGNVELLEAELLDRLDRPEFERDLLTRPPELIIADLARDLGVSKPPDIRFVRGKRRTPKDIELLEARAAAPVPTEPQPPRTATRAPPRNEITLPDDPAAAVAMVLKLGTEIRDG